MARPGSGLGLRPPRLDPAVYVKTFLVAVEERHTQSFERFHRFLLEHPALIVFLGYRLQGVDLSRPVGFDPQATLVSARHFKRKLQEMPHAYVQQLLLHTVVQLAAAGASAGETGPRRYIIRELAQGTLISPNRLLPEVTAQVRFPLLDGLVEDL